MKITPMSQGTGEPGMMHGSVEVGRSASNQRLNDAKAIARGETPQARPDIQIDPQAERILKKRTIKMKTNYSTDNYNMPPQEVVEDKQNQIAIPNPDDKVDDTAASQPISPQFAALQKQKVALQRERAAFEKEKAESQGQDKSPDILAKLKSDPLRMLQEAGVSYDDLTQALLNGTGSNPELQELRAEIKALKEGVDQNLSNRDQEAERQVLNEYLREAKAIATGNEKYKALERSKSHNDVVDLMHRTWKKTGEVMDVTMAMDLVEAELRSDLNAYADLIAPPAQSMPSQGSMPRPPMRTLTSRDGGITQMSKRDRAVAAFFGQPFKRG